MQNSSYWFSDVLQLLVSAPIRLSLFPKLLTQSKRKFQKPNLPLLALHEIKKIAKRCKFCLKNQDEQSRKSRIQNESYTPGGVIERRL